MCDDSAHSSGCVVNGYGCLLSYYWRANLVIQLARFFYRGALHLPQCSKYPSHAKNAKNAHAHSLCILPWSGFLPLDSVLAGYIHGFGVPHTERTAFTGRWGYPIRRGLRPKSSNGSLSRASESTEARDRKLARDRARRRERLASETAEEKERRLSQRRVRDRARRAASRPSAHSEKRLEQMRSTERQRRAVESQDQRETCLTRNRLSQQQRLEAESPEERETRLAQDRLSQQQRLETETPEKRETRLAQAQLSQQQ